jgi:hypothetical protein
MRRLVEAAWVAAIVGWTFAASAAGVSVDQASKEQWQAAQKTFRVADDLYDAKRFEEALTAYRASYDIVASPNSRLMIGRVLRELGRVEEAYRELEGTLADAEAAAKKDDKYEDTQRAAQAELDALKQRVAFLTIQVSNAPAGSKLSVGNREVSLEAAASKPVIVPPGPVRVEVTLPSGSKVLRELTLEAGGAKSLEINVEPGAPEKPPVTEAPPTTDTEPTSVTADTSEPSSLRTWAYVAGGVGVVGLATFAIFGVMNNSKFSDLDESCTDGHCPPERSDDIDSGKTYQTIANIGLVVGGVGLAAGATLFVLSSGKTEKRASSRATWVSVGPGSVHVGGRF